MSFGGGDFTDLCPCNSNQKKEIENFDYARILVVADNCGENKKQ